MADSTTIQVSKDLAAQLKKRKMHSNESYEDIIWDLLEDTMELSNETLKDIEEAREDFRKGKGIPFEEVKKRYGL